MRAGLPAGRGGRALVAAAAAVLLVVVLLLVRSVGADPVADPAAGPTADPAAAPTATASPRPGDPGPSPTEPTTEPTTEPPTRPAPAPAVTGPVGELAEAVAGIEAGQTHLPPVEAGEIAQTGSDVAVSLESVERVNAQASGPGEVAGPAVLLTVSITNGARGPLTLDDVVVNLYGQEGAPGSLLPGDPRTRPLAGELAPGATSTGTYVVSVPSSSNGQLIVSVSVGVDVPTPLFTTVLEES